MNQNARPGSRIPPAGSPSQLASEAKDPKRNIPSESFQPMLWTKVLSKISLCECSLFLNYIKLSLCRSGRDLQNSDSFSLNASVRAAKSYLEILDLLHAFTGCCGWCCWLNRWAFANFRTIKELPLAKSLFETAESMGMSRKLTIAFHLKPN